MPSADFQGRSIPVRMLATLVPGRMPMLDGLRGVAIALVLAHNFSTDALPPTLAGKVIGASLSVGWIGVQLFFVLSGFLITRILLQTQAAPNYYRAFFGRRVLRIFPLYYGTLLVAFVVLPLLDVVSPALAHDQGKQVWLWLYLSNCSGALLQIGPERHPTRSGAVEPEAPWN